MFVISQAVPKTFITLIGMLPRSYSVHFFRSRGELLQPILMLKAHAQAETL